MDWEIPTMSPFVAPAEVAHTAPVTAASIGGLTRVCQRQQQRQHQQERQRKLLSLMSSHKEYTKNNAGIQIKQEIKLK